MRSTKTPFHHPLALGAVLSLAAAVSFIACSGDDGSSTSTTANTGGGTTASTGNTGTGTGTGGAGGSPGTGTGTGGTGGSPGTGTGTGGTGGGAPMKPADCVDLPLTGVSLVSQLQNQFDSADAVPVVRTPSSLANVAGDPALFDRLRLLFDGDTGAGVHPMDGDPTHALPDFKQTFVPTCSTCATYEEDRDANSGAYKKVFAAKAGELEITDRLTPHQTKGTARHVELREVAADPTTGAYGWVTGGACYWIEEIAYDVRRPDGCMPFTTGGCAGDQFCMPTNAIGTDGVCVTGGTKGPGEACTPADATSWSSDCQLGLRCLDANGTTQCYQVCDVLSTAPGCPTGTHCGGGYNLCLDASITAGSGIDPALVGEPCATNAGALYCGGDGRPGTCWDDDGSGPMPATCVAWSSAPSQCTAPETAGYVAYKNGIDHSTLWCLTPP